MKRFIYFVKRIGFCNYEVWMQYKDGSADPASGATEWKALWGVRVYRYMMPGGSHLTCSAPTTAAGTTRRK